MKGGSTIWSLALSLCGKTNTTNGGQGDRAVGCSSMGEITLEQ
jgi:hypothetical protein